MKHILFTLKGCPFDLLDDKEFIRMVLFRASKECKSTLLDLTVHKFEPQGVTGIAMLAESHLSIHTWPERDYAALDVFMCGQVSPAAAVPVLRKAFQPTSLQVKNYKRGITD